MYWILLLAFDFSFVCFKFGRKPKFYCVYHSIHKNNFVYQNRRVHYWFFANFQAYNYVSEKANNPIRIYIDLCLCHKLSAL